MSQRLFVVVTTLLLLTGLLWQRSMRTHYAYTKSELDKEKIKLVKQVKTLEMEIQKLATPAVLYGYWKEHELELAFIEEANSKVAKAKQAELAKAEEEKKKKSKAHMASLNQRGSF
jgi:uncharacterized membrane protein